MTLDKEQIQKIIDEAVEKVVNDNLKDELAEEEIKEEKEVVEAEVKPTEEGVKEEGEVEDEEEPATASEAIVAEEEKADEEAEDEEKVEAEFEDEVEEGAGKDEVKDIDVQEEIEEKIEEEVGDEKEYDFLGLDIKIEEADEEDGAKRYKITIAKDDKVKEEVVESVELPIILGLIEEFFNELILEENGESEEEVAEEEKAEDGDEEVLSNMMLADLRSKYANKIEQYIEQGILAKELVLDLLKDKLANKSEVFNELKEKIKEKESILASLKEDLAKSRKKYLLAKNVENSIKKLNVVIAHEFNRISNEIKKGNLSQDEAKELVDNYKSIVAFIKNTGVTPKSIVIANKKFEELSKKTRAILASNVNKNKIKDEKFKINKVKPRNVLNRTGKVDNSSLLAHRRYDGIDEMSAEILRIAGLILEEDDI
jgi:hypothetical protein